MVAGIRGIGLRASRKWPTDESNGSWHKSKSRTAGLVPLHPERSHVGNIRVQGGGCPDLVRVSWNAGFKLRPDLVPFWIRVRH